MTVVYVAWCKDCKSGGVSTDAVHAEAEAKRHAVNRLGHEVGIYEVELPVTASKFLAYELKTTQK